MAKVKEIALGRPHQVRAYRYARRVLSARQRPGDACGGVILADGVGMGKTYEALALAATWLSQRQHFKQRKPRKLRVMVLVPPGLFTKWEDELLLPDRFRKYLEAWTSPATIPVTRTLRDVVLLRHHSDLRTTHGKLRYGRHQLPPGLYLVSSTLLHQLGRKITQLHRTTWDCIIVDEAHRHGHALLERGQALLRHKKTATILLTATPFQLTPHELRELLALTFGGYGPAGYKTAEAKAKEIYDNEAFVTYRKAVSRFFQEGAPDAVVMARRWRAKTAALLRRRVVRNPKREARRYFLVDEEGRRTAIGSGLFRFDDGQLDERLRGLGLIDLAPETAARYMRIRSQIADACTSRKRPFVAAALRQFLSSYAQFEQSDFGRRSSAHLPDDSTHPKLRATVSLAEQTIKQEQKRLRGQEFLGKMLVFTTYVGAEHGEEQPSGETAHGTARALAAQLRDKLMVLFPPPDNEMRRKIREVLISEVELQSDELKSREYERLRNAIRRFAGSRAAAYLLSRDRPLRKEARTLRRLLKHLVEAVGDGAAGTVLREEQERRAKTRRERVFQSIIDRYSTRDLVARYDGATKHADRDRHLRGFNSPFAPLVLIASSVGQEGIDLQRYCRHIVHYDLEWNPAKLEQREGRVDREGRLAIGPVNVYFPLCRGTYDERMLHVMVNRFRWHQVLLSSRNVLGGDPASSDEQVSQDVVRRIALDLRPRKYGL